MVRRNCPSDQSEKSFKLRQLSSALANWVKQEGRTPEEISAVISESSLMERVFLCW